MKTNQGSKTQPQWQLININTQEKTIINKAVMIVGRHTTADILCRSTLVSRDHARFLSLADGSLQVEDKRVSFFQWSVLQYMYKPRKTDWSNKFKRWILL